MTITASSESRTDAMAAAAPILTLLAVAVIRKGAFFRPDIVVTPALCIALALSARQVRHWLRTHMPAAVAIVIATAWWVGDGLLWRHSTNSWELPGAWLALAAAYATTRALSAEARRTALVGVAAAGVALALAALALIGVRSRVWTFVDERSLRFAGPFTYPSAAGLFLVLALLAGADLDAVTSRRWQQLVDVGAALTVLGVIATDSRGSVLALIVVMFFRKIRSRIGAPALAAVVAAPLLLIGQRADFSHWLILAAAALAATLCLLPHIAARRLLQVAIVPAAGIVGWLLITQHHAVSGLDASWTERGTILRGAATVFRRHPIFGAGPDPLIPAHTLAGQPGIAYFAHDEVVEVFISVGVIGVVVLSACAALVVRALYRNSSTLASPVLASAVAAGLVDFVWHFPALGLACGVVAAAGRSRVRTAPIPLRGEPDGEPDAT
jgi:O-Antigen ligase